MDIAPPFGTKEILHGIIFNDGEEVWMGIYGGGTVREFNVLSDYEGVYTDLEESKIAFVEIQHGVEDQVWIKDVCVFEIGRRGTDGEPAEDFGDVGVPEILGEMEFPSDDSDLMFQAFLTETRKAN